jgi:crotonobetainyl-CoA:carnitine CoA-transferase CaiB-like acyl-CoA transferase
LAENPFPGRQTQGSSILFTGKTAPIASSPRMGQHNGEVYRELLGFSTEDIHAMERKKII